jgi:hypothetical protein
MRNPTYNSAGCALLGVCLAELLLKAGPGVAADLLEAKPRREIGSTIGKPWLHTGVIGIEAGVRVLLKLLLFSKRGAAVDPDHEAPFVYNFECQ